MRACSLPARFFLVLSMFVLASCSTTSSTSEALQLANANQNVDQSSGKYPDFSRPLTSAMAQMSDAEASQMQGELTALSDGRKSGAISEAEYWRRVKELEALAANHGQDMVTAIEKVQ